MQHDRRHTWTCFRYVRLFVKIISTPGSTDNVECQHVLTVKFSKLKDAVRRVICFSGKETLYVHAVSKFSHLFRESFQHYNGSLMEMSLNDTHLVVVDEQRCDMFLRHILIVQIQFPEITTEGIAGLFKY